MSIGQKATNDISSKIKLYQRPDEKDKRDIKYTSLFYMRFYYKWSTEILIKVCIADNHGLPGTAPDEYMKHKEIEYKLGWILFY